MTYEKHLRSSVIGKLPTAAQLAEGQIAINFAASDPFLSIKDSAGTVRRLGGTTASATAPTSPKPGDLWVDVSTSALPVLNVWNGTAWVRAGGGGTSSATAPTSPSRGDAWLNTSGTGTPSLGVWDGSKWVPLASTDGPTFTGTPAGPTAAVGTDTTQLATTAFVQAAQLFTRATGTISAKTAGDKLAPATLPLATTTAVGGIKVGTGLSVAADGTLKVSVAGALIFKGAADPTAAAPATPATGDVWVMSKGGVLAASWTGIAGGTVSVHEVVAWDGTEWTVMGAIGGAAITGVTTTAPLQSTGTSSIALTVDDATTTAKGVVRLADAAAVTAATSGRVVDAAQLRAAAVWSRTGSTLSPATTGDLVAAAALPAATAAALGGVKVGTGLSVTGDGTLKVNVTGALIFKGATDPTTAAPATPKTGDVWVMNKAGVLEASWTGIAGGTVSLHEVVAFDGTEWTVMGAVGGTAITTITTTAPLQHTGTSTTALTIDDATTAARGVVQLASAADLTAGTAGRVVDAAQLKAENLWNRSGTTLSPATSGDLLTPAVLPAATAAAQGAVRLADAAAITDGTAGRVVDAAQFKVFNGAFFAIDGGFANSTYGGAPAAVDGGRA